MSRTVPVSNLYCPDWTNHPDGIPQKITYMHTKNILTAGRKLEEADKALIMVHGRGGRAADILFLADELAVGNYALLAPQATGNTWYPYSFMAPPAQNEPYLSSALQTLKDLAADINAAGIPNERIYLLGFSQGACLTLEFVTRNATRYGGVAAFTGGPPPAAHSLHGDNGAWSVHCPRLRQTHAVRSPLPPRPRGTAPELGADTVRVLDEVAASRR